MGDIEERATDRGGWTTEDAIDVDKRGSEQRLPPPFAATALDSFSKHFFRGGADALSVYARRCCCPAAAPPLWRRCANRRCQRRRRHRLWRRRARFPLSLPFLLPPFRVRLSPVRGDRSVERRGARRRAVSQSQGKPPATVLAAAAAARDKIEMGSFSIWM